MIYALTIIYLLGCAQELRRWRLFITLYRSSGSTISDAHAFWGGVVAVPIWPFTSIIYLITKGNNTQNPTDGIDT